MDVLAKNGKNATRLGDDDDEERVCFETLKWKSNETRTTRACKQRLSFLHWSDQRGCGGVTFLAEQFAAAFYPAVDEGYVLHVGVDCAWRATVAAATLLFKWKGKPSLSFKQTLVGPQFFWFEQLCG
eukprot:1160826-Pelagomonas_calceolata.AAC.2